MDDRELAALRAGEPDGFVRELLVCERPGLLDIFRVIGPIPFS
jgi:hypothetical protein